MKFDSSREVFVQRRVAQMRLLHQATWGDLEDRAAAANRTWLSISSSSDGTKLAAGVKRQRRDADRPAGCTH
jgi:hypothetical protein